MVESIFDLTLLKIYKPSFMFFEAIPKCQKSGSFIYFFLRYSWFKNTAIWLADIFDHAQLKIFKSIF